MKNKGKEEKKGEEREGVSPHEVVGKRGPLQRGEGIGKVERRWASKMLFACTHRDSRRNKEGGRGEGQHTPLVSVHVPMRGSLPLSHPPSSPHGHLLLPLLPVVTYPVLQCNPLQGWMEGGKVGGMKRGRLFYGPRAGGRDLGSRHCKRMREGDE